MEHNLNNFIENINCAIDALVTGRSNLGYGLLPVIIDSLSKYIEIFDTSERVSINDILIEMMEAIKNKDDVLIADILEYEVKQLFID